MNLTRAIKRYNARLAPFQIYRDYSRGDQELRFATTEFKNEFGAEMKSIRENLCGMLISAFVDKLNITDWGSEANNAIAEQLGLARLLNVVFAESFRCGHGYMVVANLPDGSKLPVTQRADQLVVQTDPLNPSILSDAARFWTDEDCVPHITLWDSTTVTELVGMKPLQHDDMGLLEVKAFPERDSDYIEESVSLHGFQSVPVAQVKHGSEDAWDDGISILADAIPLQDALNKSLADTIVLSGTYALPFWYLLSYSPKAPENPFLAAKQLASALGQSQPAVPAVGNLPARDHVRFNRGEQKIFATDSPGPFGQLDPPDISKMLEVQDGFALKMARVVGLPSYYITQTMGDVPSGASLRVLAARMTARCARYQLDAEPVLKGIGELLGMVYPKVTWEDVSPLDDVERVTVADVKFNKLGYSLRDAIAELDEADVEGIVERAEDKALEGRLDLTGGGLVGLG